jgi:tRNA-specific 2-thiouridylase
MPEENLYPMDASMGAENRTKAGRVAIALSGGVDSSVAAAILKEAGYDLVGFSMQLWDQRRNDPQMEGHPQGRCCSIDDLFDARGVAAHLNFPYYVINLQREFEETVVKPFIESYRNGLTPSPCVLCNSHMKFDRLMRVAEEVNAVRIATGHYARVGHDSESGRYRLLKALDRNKDQSYFLFELNQKQLARAIFPLGGLTKPQVREIARRHGLPVSEKPESQEICFVPDDDYSGFIERHYGELMGPEAGGQAFPGGEIVDSKSNVLGTHRGIHHYTVGQRRGLGIAHPAPLYVIELRPEESRVVVGERSELGRRSFGLLRPNWVSIPELNAPLRVSAKIRSRHAEAPASITPLEDGSVRVEFDTPQLAVTPGQACVFYQGDVVLGGGWIARFTGP